MTIRAPDSCCPARRDFQTQMNYGYPGQPEAQYSTNYRPLPPLPRHLSFSNPPSPVDPTLPPSSAGSTPAADSDKASPNLTLAQTPSTAAGSTAGGGSAKKKRPAGAAQASEDGGSGFHSPADQAESSGQKESAGKDGKGPTKRVKVSLVLSNHEPADSSLSSASL